jgi:hypothetical protein
LESPARAMSTPVTNAHSAKKTLSRPSPQPRSSTRAPAGSRALTCRASEDASVPQM